MAFQVSWIEFEDADSSLLMKDFLRCLYAINTSPAMRRDIRAIPPNRAKAADDSMTIPSDFLACFLWFVLKSFSCPYCATTENEFNRLDF